MSILDKILARANLTETKSKIFKNIFWATLGRVINLLGALLVGILVAKYLGPENYGLMSYVVSFVSLFQILATFGLDNVEIREESKNTEKKDIIIGSAFTIRLILSFLTIIIICITAFINEADSFTIFLILLYSVSIFFTSFDVIRNYFTSIVLNEYVVKVGIARTLLSCAVKLILVFVGAPLVWFVATLVFDSFIGAEGYYMAYKKKVGTIVGKWKFDYSTTKYLLSQAFPLLLSGAAATIFLQIDQVMIGNMIDKESVGFFSIAAKIVEVPMFVPVVLAQTVTPILVRIKKNDECTYLSKAQMFMNISLWISVIMSICLSALSYWAIYLTFGVAYLPSVLILKILSFKIVAATLNVISGQILIVDGKQKFFVLRSLSGCIVCILLNLIFIPRFGTIGAAFIAVVTQFVAGFLIHAILPIYRYMFSIQLKAVLWGWKDLINIKKLIKE